MIDVAEMLISAAIEFPNRVAAVDSKREITYESLLYKSIELARRISEKTKGSRCSVLVLSDRSISTIIALWAVILSGNYYVAIDYKTPQKRIQKLSQIAKAGLAVLSIPNKVELNIPKIDLSDVDLSEDSVEYERKRIIDEDPLYMVFTSGSTGQPRPVIKSHRSMISFVESFMSVFKLDNGEIFGNQASFDYDVAAKDLFLSTYLVGTICLIPSKCFTIPSLLAPYLIKNKVSALIWSTAAVKYVSRMDCFRNEKPTLISKVFFSGESISTKTLNYWKSRLNDTFFVNLYAPSEVTGNCLYHIYNESDEKEIQCPLTDVFPNVDVMILDEKQSVMKCGKGEIYVRGAFLADGYYGDLKLTKQKFMQNPLHSDYTDIVYKTGDLAVKDGENIYISGRIDNQIKHMGHRVEIEEIEAVIISIVNNEEICVVYDKEVDEIVLLMKGNDYSEESMIKRLRDFLPAHMIPNKIESVPSLPYNGRGKIDRKAAFNEYKKLTMDKEG